ncbi:MAG: 2-amino-4-hydroxy-6-hydroxymethyldihydropteridine diphosphokinase, partial [Flavobacteriales bacterium]
PAWGFESSNAFLNAVFAFAMAELPSNLMNTIISIERRLGRKRSGTPGYASRTIDIDVIAIGDQIISSDELFVPHPRMQDRLFVLKPMADVCPEWRHPIFNQSTTELLQHCTDKSEIKIWDSPTTT